MNASSVSPPRDKNQETRPANAARANMLISMLVLFLSSTIGAAPTVLLMGGWALLGVYALFCAVLALIKTVMAGSKAFSTTRVTLQHLVLGAFGVTYQFATRALRILSFWGLIFGGIIVAGPLLRWARLSDNVDAATLVFWLVILLVSVPIGMLYLSSDPVKAAIPQLYAGSSAAQQAQSAWFASIRSPRFVRGLGGSLIAVALAGLWLGVNKIAFPELYYLLLQVYVGTITAPLNAGTRTAQPGPERQSQQRATILEAVRKLLRAAKYEVQTPQSNEPSVQSLITSVDLLALDQEHAYAIEVKTRRGTTAPVGWGAASTLRMAVQVLENSGAGEPSRSLTFEPVLILVGREQSESLQSYTSQEHFLVLEIPEKAISRVSKAHDTELANLAQTYLSRLSSWSTSLVTPRGQTQQL